MSHNVKSIRWSGSNHSSVTCDAGVEDRLTNILQNHLYMEHGLQTAYTAAAMFLFQDAVVKNAPTSPTRYGPPMPNDACTADGTATKMIVWLSLPKQNAMMTLAGCGLLALLVVATSLVSCYHETRGSGALRDITAPGEIAQLLLNESRYAFALLDRRVVANHDTTEEDERLECYGIQSLTLSRPRVAPHDCVTTSHGYTRGAVLASFE
ncbi:hypothetical protein PINS_up010821 [Pythium insidiosum]|nr:hypothetical protein PINS_up010821 [Pythium insidiosum]